MAGSGSSQKLLAFRVCLPPVLFLRWFFRWFFPKYFWNFRKKIRNFHRQITDFYKKIWFFIKKIWVASSGWTIFWHSVADSGWGHLHLKLSVHVTPRSPQMLVDMQTIPCVHDFCSFSCCFIHFCRQSQRISGIDACACFAFSFSFSFSLSLSLEWSGCTKYVCNQIESRTMHSRTHAIPECSRLHSVSGLEQENSNLLFPRWLLH